MKIKAGLFCGIVGTALLVSPNIFASIIGTGSLYITAPGFNSPNWDQAGPYQVSSLTVATGANPGASFSTFCIGSQVDYYPGNTYDYQISDTVQPSGIIGGPGYVTWGAAWLYSHYITGAIGGGVGVNNAANDALQELLWNLQGQNTSGVTFSPDTAAYATYLADVNAAAALNHTTTGADADGAFGVYALNMYTVSGNTTTYWQPQLCMVPVPEPSTYVAGAMMLLPLGASALRNARKRLSKAS